MAKKAAAKTVNKKSVTKKKPATKKEKKPSIVGRVIISLLAVLGMGVMGYLTTLHDDGSASFCDVNAKLSCSAVNNSDYSELLGIPVSYMGLGFFALVLLIMLFKYSRESLKLVAFISIVFLGPSLYLTSLEIFVIESICLFCELSKVIVLTVAITALATLKLKGEERKQLLSSGIVVALLMAALTFMIFRMTAEKVDPGQYEEFAIDLTEDGWIMYGSETCQFCGKQREAFGDSFEHITEIECDPRNENDQAELCVAKEIDHTPTWVQEDENGATINKLSSGMYPLDKLSELTGVPLPE